jgi:LysR family transcriptional regulator of gallate degradation
MPLLREALAVEHLDSSALRVNLRYLHTFIAVAKSGSIANAAKILFRAPSAVARAICALETALQADLFERKPHGLLVSAYGRALLLRAKQVEQELACACEQVNGSSANGRAINAASLMILMFNGRRVAAVASLAEMHNMASVAQQLQMTQPAISALVRELESRLGVALFQRSPKGVTPTPYGDALAFRFTRVLAELRNIEPDIRAIDGISAGRIAIGALPLCRAQLLPMAVASLVRKHPQVRVSTVESPYESLIAGLRSGDIDLVVGAFRSPIDIPDLEQIPLFEDELAIVVRAGHPLTQMENVRVQDLNRWPWVLAPSGAPSRAKLETAFSCADERAPVPAVQTGDLAVLRGLLLHGDMITSTSPYQLRYELDSGELVALKSPIPGSQRTIGVVLRLGARPCQAVYALVDELRGATAKYLLRDKKSTEAKAVAFRIGAAALLQ